MTTTNRDDINRRTENHHLLRRLCAGVDSVKTVPIMRLLLAVFLAAMALLWVFRGAVFATDTFGPLAKLFDALVQILLAVCTVVGFIAILIIMGTPWGSKRAREDLQKIGLINHAGEAPILVSKKQDKNNPRLTVWEFDPCGIPLKEWEDKQARIETALNIIIAKMVWGVGRKIIRVYAVPAESDILAIVK